MSLISKLILGALVLCFTAAGASAQKWNPKPGWKDSVEVNGKCYCDSNGFDHGLGGKSLTMPDGKKMNIKEVCKGVGKAPSGKKIPYNDIQCGNGPANNAPDEKGCPGRVDIGPKGCNVKGPKFDLSWYKGGDNGGDPGNGNGLKQCLNDCKAQGLKKKKLRQCKKQCRKKF